MGTKAWLLSSALLLGCPFLVDNAQAAQHERHGHAVLKPTVAYRTHSPRSQDTLAQGTLAFGARVSHGVHYARRGASRSWGISCVPYARQVSGIEVAGNAWQWWTNAAGRYARGDQPEPGSVLNFRANGRMRLGHVAVVTQVVNAREIIVDQANWPSGGGIGGVSHNISVVDVSEANNWSAVRVELGREGTFGSVYPTYGFIYNRPDTGIVTASVERPSPQPAINPVPSDLRPAAERPWQTTEEVAEAPAMRQRIDMSVCTTPIQIER
jgi:surface antigen